MAIVLSNPSKQTIDALRRGLQELGRALPDATAPRGQHIFTIALDRMAQGATLADARAAGWQFLVGEGRNAFLADVSEAGAAPPSLTRVAEGRRAADTIRDTSRLDEYPQLRDGNYEVRVLRLNGIRTDSFWLNGQGGAGDYILPYATSSRMVESRLYPAGEFLAIATDLARAQIEYDLPMQNPPAQQ